MSDTRTVVGRGAQHWDCPFCNAVNGFPEIGVCACGARLDGTVATKPAPVVKPDTKIEAKSKDDA